MKQEKILEILRRLDCDEHDIHIDSQERLHHGATLTYFTVVEDCGCGPAHDIDVYCVTYEGDETHLFHPNDWLGGTDDPVDEVPWLDQDNGEAIMIDGLPHAAE